MSLASLRIAVLSLHLPQSQEKRGGVAYVAHRLANALVDRGHRVTIFSVDPRPPGARYEVKQVVLPYPQTPWSRWRWNWTVVRKFARQDFSSFDVLHAHGDDALVVRPGIPLVRTFHGAALGEAIHAPTWKKRLWYLTFVPREVWEAAKATIAVAVSANTRRYLPFIDRVIPNGVDLSLFHPGHTKNEHPSILFVGTLRGRKRGNELIRIFRQEVLPARPDAELWLVSGEKVETVPHIRSFLHPSTRQLADLYRQAWVFCLPSSYEGFGVPYIEAMASGTPVVATPNDGAREVLDEGRWGLLVPLKEIGQTLVRLLSREEERHYWAQQGLRRVRDFSLERVVDAYEALFREIASSKVKPKRFKRDTS
jgi:Glycosyltransferase